MRTSMWWPCKCGSWSWLGRTSCFKCHAAPPKWAAELQRSGDGRGAQNADGQSPTTYVDLEGYVKQPREKKARRAAKRAARLGNPGAGKEQTEHGDVFGKVDDNDMEVDCKTDATEQAIAAELEALKLVQHDGIAAIRADKQSRLEALRSARRAARSPATRLMEAQRLSRRTEQRREKAELSLAELREKRSKLDADIAAAEVVLAESQASERDAKQAHSALTRDLAAPETLEAADVALQSAPPEVQQAAMLVHHWKQQQQPAVHVVAGEGETPAAWATDDDVMELERQSLAAKRASQAVESRLLAAKRARAEGVQCGEAGSGASNPGPAVAPGGGVGAGAQRRTSSMPAGRDGLWDAAKRRSRSPVRDLRYAGRRPLDS